MTLSFPAFTAGMVLSLSLIMAIGPQNAHVLRMGLQRQHVWLTVAVCTLADIVLISLGVLGLAGMASGGTGLLVPESVMNFDIWVMLAVALACIPVFISGREIARWEGAVFLLYYVAYVAYLIMAATDHAALGAFSSVMLGFVVPLTVVTLVVVLLGKKSTLPS